MEHRKLITLALSQPGLAVEHVRSVLNYDPLRSWFYFALVRQHAFASIGAGLEGTYFEFGVGSGGSLVKYLSALRAFCRHFGLLPKNFQIVGFDSFAGLPSPRDPKDINPKQWREGSFASSADEVMDCLRKAGFNLNSFELSFVVGDYFETLNVELRTRFVSSPPSIINIDVDYYSSTLQVLRWLRPILPTGALFHFDDVWTFHGHPELGELGAITDFNNDKDGCLTPYPALGSTALSGKTYLYSRKSYEYSATGESGSKSSSSK